MLGIHFRLIDVKVHDSFWNTTTVYIVTYVLIINFLISSLS